MDIIRIVAILLVIAGSVRFLLKQGRRLLGRRDSQPWAWAKTTVGYGYVDRISEGEGGTAHKLTVSYSYAVDGKDYVGDYTECFATEQEAQDLLKRLRELPPPARYKPGDPSVSVMDPYRDAAQGVTST